MSYVAGRGGRSSGAKGIGNSVLWNNCSILERAVFNWVLKLRVLTEVKWCIAIFLNESYNVWKGIINHQQKRISNKDVTGRSNAITSVM